MTANCNNTQTGNNPLYPGTIPAVNEAHLALGVEIGKLVQKVNGKLVVMFAGMSNWRQEIQEFTRLSRRQGIRGITWYNAGRGAWDLSRMVASADEYWAWVQTGMAKRNITGEQVQVLFLKNSVRHGGTVENYKGLLDKQVERAKKELPGLRQIFISSAVYSGYASTGAPRTEPDAYFEGVAVDQYVKEHYNREQPWISWGPYLWADGLRPRGDGLVWKCTDFELKDGVHPGPLAEAKVADMVFRFMKNSQTTGWFTGG